MNHWQPACTARFSCVSSFQKMNINDLLLLYVGQKYKKKKKNKWIQLHRILQRRGARRIQHLLPEHLLMMNFIRTVVKINYLIIILRDTIQRQLVSTSALIPVKYLISCRSKLIYQRRQSKKCLLNAISWAYLKEVGYSQRTISTTEALFSRKPPKFKPIVGPVDPDGFYLQCF